VTAIHFLTKVTFGHITSFFYNKKTMNRVVVFTLSAKWKQSYIDYHMIDSDDEGYGKGYESNEENDDMDYY